MLVDVLLACAQFFRNTANIHALGKVEQKDFFLFWGQCIDVLNDEGDNFISCNLNFVKLCSPFVLVYGPCFLQSGLSF